jgi:hypothetical protein
MTQNKPPSRIRYDQNNPPVTIRLTKNLREKIDRVRNGRPYGMIVKEIVSEAVEILKQLEEARKTIQNQQKEIELLKSQKQA